jgi:hypothetical protein
MTPQQETNAYACVRVLAKCTVKDAMSKMVGLSDDLRQQLQREEKTEEEVLEENNGEEEDKPMTAEMKRADR